MAGRPSPADEKTPGTIEVEVIMSRTVHKGSFLLVEGEDDVRFFSSRIAKRDCQLIDCRGKVLALEAIRRLNSRRFRGALTVIDDDFDALGETAAGLPNVVTTDAHDLECLLLRSPALEAVLDQCGDLNRIQTFERQHGHKVREALLERGLVLGRLRWLAVRNGWNINFKPMKPARFLDETTWQLNREQLFTEVVRLGMPLSVAEVEQAQAALPVVDPWRVCRGHDLVDILVVGLKGVLGMSGNPGRDILGKMLQLAMHRPDFAATGLYRDIRNWEQTNVPYVVLPP